MFQMVYQFGIEDGVIIYDGFVDGCANWNQERLSGANNILK